MAGSRDGGALPEGDEVNIEIVKAPYSGWYLIADEREPRTGREVVILSSYTYFHRKWLAEWARDYVLAESPVDFSLSLADIRKHRDWITPHTRIAAFLKRVGNKARHWKITREEFPDWIEGIE